MRRAVSLIGVVALLGCGSANLAWAGGRYHHHGTPPAVWWGLGTALALGTIGVVTAARQPPPPMPLPPRAVTHLYCPA